MQMGVVPRRPHHFGSSRPHNGHLAFRLACEGVGRKGLAVDRMERLGAAGLDKPCFRTFRKHVSICLRIPGAVALGRLFAEKSAGASISPLRAVRIVLTVS